MKAKELMILLSKTNAEAEVCYVARFGDPPRRIIDAVLTLDNTTIYLVPQVNKSGPREKKR